MCASVCVCVLSESSVHYLQLVYVSIKRGYRCVTILPHIGGWAGLAKFPLTHWFIAEFPHNGAKTQTKLFPDQRVHGFGWINRVDLYPKSWKWKTMVEFFSFADAGAALDSDTQHPRCQTSPD